MMDTATLLAERKTTHGNYDDDACCAMGLIITLQDHIYPDDRLTNVQLHALHMICHKIARIVTGKADFKDHWDDIAGYAKLVADRCEVPVVDERNSRPGRRDDDQQESPYHVERVTLAEVREPVGKQPCHCHPGLCVAEKGVPPKFVYCRKAEGEEDEPKRIVPRRGGYDPFKEEA